MMAPPSSPSDSGMFTEFSIEAVKDIYTKREAHTLASDPIVKIKRVNDPDQVNIVVFRATKGQLKRLVA